MTEIFVCRERALRIHGWQRKLYVLQKPIVKPLAKDTNLRRLRHVVDYAMISRNMNMIMVMIMIMSMTMTTTMIVVPVGVIGIFATTGTMIMITIMMAYVIGGITITTMITIIIGG